MIGRKYQRDNRKKLLFEVLKAGGAITLVFIAPGAAPTLLQRFMKENDIDNKKLKRALNELSKDGLISTKENTEGVITVKLRKDGKVKALKYQIEEMELKRPKKWDKKWRIVMFDIPEEKKLARNILQAKLTELGFRTIQKSVYVHPYPCEEEIEFIRSVYEIRPYVSVITANKIENETFLKKRFGL